MSNNGGTSQTQTAQAPSWQQPYQGYGLNQSLAQYQGVNSPQQLVAGFSPLQNQALTGIQGVATNNPTSSALNNYVTNTLNGQPANNPYLNSEFTQGAQQVQNQLDSEFANSGRGVIGSLPVQSDELNNLATQLYGGAYNTGVQQQETAAGLAPGAVNTSLALPQAEFGAGQQVQNLAQNYITAPQTFLNQYLSRVNGNLGTTASQPLYYNPGLMALGGANLGGSLGSTIAGLLGGSSTTGQGIGTLAGGLLGAFS